MNISKKQIHKLVLESLLLEGKYSTLIDLFKKAFNVNRVSDVPITKMKGAALERMYEKMTNIELATKNPKYYGEAVGSDLADYQKMERALQRKLSGKPPSSPSPARKTTVAAKTVVTKITKTQIDNFVNSPNAAQKLNKVANSKEAAKILDELMDYYDAKKVNEWSLIKKYITKSKDYKDVVKYKQRLMSEKVDLIDNFKKLGIQDKEKMKNIIIADSMDDIALQIYGRGVRYLTKTESAAIMELRKKIISFVNNIKFYKSASNKFSAESKNRIIRFFKWFGKNPIKTFFIATAAIAVFGLSAVISGLLTPVKVATEILKIYNNSEESWTLMTYHKIRKLFGKKVPQKFLDKMQESEKDQKRFKYWKNRKMTPKEMKKLRKEYEDAMRNPIP